MTKIKIGKYTLIRQIAQGGMAEIWLAEQRGPGGFNKELVIKRILPHLASEGQFTEMFMDEARIVAHLNHPNIGQVFELGEQEGDYFIAMEFIDGLDLAQLRDKLDERGMRLPVHYAARIICDILAALDYAHEFRDRQGNHVGLIHRDISPQNVLISKEGVVKLVDFGVAKAASNSSKTETGAVKGKFAYMAPEQIEGGQLDRRVDLFAIGCVFYELLAGKKPFGDDLKAVSMILAGQRQELRELREDVPEEIGRIISRALSRNREDRYSTAVEMEQELERFLHANYDPVGTRELSVMIRQLLDLPISQPTKQLFGFEKHGVERHRPRITVKESVPVILEQKSSVQSSEGVAPQVSEQTPEPSRPKAPSLQGAHIPQSAPSTGNTLAMQVKKEGMSLPLIFTFLGILFALVAAAGVAAYIVIGKKAEESTEMSASVVEENAQPAEKEPPRRALHPWHHDDGLIIVIDANKPAELYRNGRKVGETPYETQLRPGSYYLELRSEGKKKTEMIRVDAGRTIQNYRFEL